MKLPELTANVTFFHDGTFDLVCRLGAAAMCFGMMASLALFHFERTRRR